MHFRRVASWGGVGDFSGFFVFCFLCLGIIHFLSSVCSVPHILQIMVEVVERDVALE